MDNHPGKMEVCQIEKKCSWVKANKISKTKNKKTKQKTKKAR